MALWEALLTAADFCRDLARSGRRDVSDCRLFHIYFDASPTAVE